MVVLRSQSSKKQSELYYMEKYSNNESDSSLPDLHSLGIVDDIPYAWKLDCTLKITPFLPDWLQPSFEQQTTKLCLQT